MRSELAGPFRGAAFAAATVLTALAAAPAAAAAAATPSVFDWERARAFCQNGDADRADRCLVDQQRAGHRIDEWLISGRFAYPGSRHAFQRCDARYRPELRQTWRCLDELRDSRRKRFP